MKITLSLEVTFSQKAERKNDHYSYPSVFWDLLTDDERKKLGRSANPSPHNHRQIKPLE